MGMPAEGTSDHQIRIPVIIQELPDLRYGNDEWMAQNGRKIAIGSISTATLKTLYRVDRVNQSDNPNGYQREAVKTRVTSLVRELKAKRVDLPTAILLNLRKFQASQLFSDDGTSHTLVLGKDDHLYVVDGQHRVESLIALFDENPDAWGSYAIPFVCLLGSDLNGEMTEFHVVNSNAKSIGTGLAMDLLKRRAEASDVVRDQLVETGRVWINTASQLTDTLKKTDIWQGKIQFPGQSKSGTLITNNGLTTSLRPLVEQPGYFQSVGDPEQQCRILDAYWKGIGMVLPEAMADPERFNLQRTLGTTALHGVLVNVLAVMVSQSKSVLNPNDYADIMREPLSELGETNGEGTFVDGADFWKRGAEGASGLFNGRAWQPCAPGQNQGPPSEPYGSLATGLKITALGGQLVAGHYSCGANGQLTATGLHLLHVRTYAVESHALPQRGEG